MKELEIFTIVDVTHVARVGKFAVECERCGERVGRLATLTHLEVIPEELAVHRVGAVLDYGLCTLYGILAAEIGNSLIGDEDVDRVFAVVRMRYHRDDVADQSAFGDRRTAENGDVGVTGEIARTAYAVHHTCAENVCRVDTSEDIGLKGGVHRYDAETAYYLRIV